MGIELVPLIKWINQEVNKVVSGKCGVIPFGPHALSYCMNSTPCCLFLTRLLLVLGHQHNTLEEVMDIESWPRSAPYELNPWVTDPVRRLWSTLPAAHTMRSLPITAHIYFSLQTLNCECVEGAVSRIACLHSPFWSVNNPFFLFHFIYHLFALHICSPSWLPSSPPIEANIYGHQKASIPMASSCYC